MPAYIPSIWKIKEPPKIHVFLWLLSKNMLMTVDNLSHRGVSKPQECQFRLEHKSIHHLLFDCVVVKYDWACTTCSLVFILAIILIWLVNGRVKKNCSE